MHVLVNSVNTFDRQLILSKIVHDCYWQFNDMFQVNSAHQVTSTMFAFFCPFDSAYQ